MSFILILALLFILPVISGLVFGAKSRSRAGKVLAWLCAGISPVIISLFFLSMNGFFAGRTNVEGWLIICGCMLVLLLWALIISGRIRRKKYLIVFGALCLCFIIAITGYRMWSSYQQSIPVLTETKDTLSDYDPLREDNKLARTQQPATLVLEGALPRLDGATALYPVYAAFANAVYPEGALQDAVYTADPWGWVEENALLRCSTTSGAYTALADGEADIIFVAAPSEEQLKYAEELGEEMVFTPIGSEGFVFFVNAENPIRDLSVEQLRGIYSGEITRWEELGVNLGKIRPFQRNEGSGSQSTLVRFMGDTPLMDPPTEDRIDGMGGIITCTADYRNYKNAIGYSFRFYSTEMVNNDQIRLLSINGVSPTVENIASGAYPLGGEFYAVTLASNKNPNVDALIDWILSDQGQELIEKTGYIPLD